ncbi:unnamed protein product [Effrenium voratum]|uniref:Uncharacterized protein n=2 Tax=Effrenium voratum TaxID=2562239 RepID=A0AA36HSQ4_9DINO|nr:unnamed protein product [Effrenium voratum]CAJ1419578.1 unnamed protein product [Effrenium voratum]
MQPRLQWLPELGLCVRRFGAGAIAMKVGKCKGLTFEECLAKQPRYCNWLLQRKTMGPEYDDFLKFLRGRAQATPKASEPLREERAPKYDQGKDADDADEPVGFGKHAELTYAEVVRVQPQYCSWAKGKYEEMQAKEPGQMSPAFKAFGEYLQGVDLPTSSKRFGKSQDCERTDRYPERGAPRSSLASDQKLASGGWQVSFGKHLGITFDEVYRKDPQFCEFVVNAVLNDDQKVNPGMLALAVYVQHKVLEQHASE